VDFSSLHVERRKMEECSFYLEEKRSGGVGKGGVWSSSFKFKLLHLEEPLKNKETISLPFLTLWGEGSTLFFRVGKRIRGRETHLRPPSRKNESKSLLLRPCEKKKGERGGGEKQKKISSARKKEREALSLSDEGEKKQKEGNDSARKSRPLPSPREKSGKREGKGGPYPREEGLVLEQGETKGEVFSFGPFFDRNLKGPTPSSSQGIGVLISEGEEEKVHS